jgi:hypothetical protein
MSMPARSVPCGCSARRRRPVEDFQAEYVQADAVIFCLQHGLTADVIRHYHCESTEVFRQRGLTITNNQTWPRILIGVYWILVAHKF